MKSQKSQNRSNWGFSYYFCLMIEGSRSWAVPLTPDPDSGGLKTYGSSGSATLPLSKFISMSIALASFLSSSVSCASFFHPFFLRLRESVPQITSLLLVPGSSSGKIQEINHTFKKKYFVFESYRMRIPSSFQKILFSRGHLANISNNLLITAINSENGEMNKVGLKVRFLKLLTMRESVITPDQSLLCG